MSPIWVPDDEFVREWQQKEYMGKEFVEGTPEFYTENVIAVGECYEKKVMV